MEFENKQYFLPGDVVSLRQNIPNKPIMIIVKKVTKTIKIGNTKNDYFQGMLCRWFTTTGELMESQFNTKDLVVVK